MWWGVHYALPDIRECRSSGREGSAEAQVVRWRSVSWLIIAPIVVVNVAALCRKWPVNITVALPSPSLPCPVASHTNSPKIPRCDLRVSDFRRRIYDGPIRSLRIPRKDRRDEISVNFSNQWLDNLVSISIPSILPGNKSAFLL